MNPILQKRIEEAARECDYQYEKEERAFISAGNYALKNQWISVEEALPEMIDEDMEWSDFVLIKCKNCEDMKPCIMTSRYDVGTGFWLNPVAREITHWTEIPKFNK